jgi:hypothetical protein
MCSVNICTKHVPKVGSLTLLLGLCFARSSYTVSQISSSCAIVTYIIVIKIRSWISRSHCGVRLSLPLTGLFYQPRMIDECGAVSEMRICRGKCVKYSEKICPSATLSTKIHDPGGRGGKLGTNRLSYGAALLTVVTTVTTNFRFVASCSSETSRLQGFLDNRLTALRAGRPVPPPPGRFLVLDPMAIVRLEGFGQLKNPMISSGIQPANFRLVA